MKSRLFLFFFSFFFLSLSLVGQTKQAFDEEKCFVWAGGKALSDNIGDRSLAEQVRNPDLTLEEATEIVRESDFFKLVYLPVISQINKSCQEFTRR